MHDTVLGSLDGYIIVFLLSLKRVLFQLIKYQPWTVTPSHANSDFIAAYTRGAAARGRAQLGPPPRWSGSAGD